MHNNLSVCFEVQSTEFGQDQGIIWLQWEERPLALGSNGSEVPPPQTLSSYTMDLQGHTPFWQVRVLWCRAEGQEPRSQFKGSRNHSMGYIPCKDSKILPSCLASSHKFPNERRIQRSSCCYRYGSQMVRVGSGLVSNPHGPTTFVSPTKWPVTVPCQTEGST